MKSKLLSLIFLSLVANATHTTERKIYATDITNKSGSAVLKLPTALPTASRVATINADGEIDGSSVSTTTLGYLDASSSIQTQLNAKDSVLTFDAPLSRSTNAISCIAATGSVDGCLSSTDWNTFNNKQASGNYITALTGDVTASGPGSVAGTIANDAVTYAKMQNVAAASRLLGRGSAGGSGDVEEITISTGLTLTGTTLTASASPGGSTTQVQYNSSGAFAGSASFIWDNTNAWLGVGNSLSAPKANFHADALNSAAAPNLFQMTHGSQTGVTATDGFYCGYPSGSSSVLTCKFNETSAALNWNYGSTTYLQLTSSALSLTSPGGAAVITGNSARWIVGSSNDNFRGLLAIEGNIGWDVNRTSSNRTLGVNTEGTVSMDASGGTKTVTLDGAANEGHVQIVQKSDTSANAVSVLRSSSDTLGGAGDAITQYDIVNQGEAMLLNSNGSTNWIVASDNRAPIVLSKSTDYTVTAIHKDQTILCTPSGADLTMTLYAAARHIGWKVTLKKLGAAAFSCIADGNASENVEGATTASTGIVENACKTYQSDGTAWYLISDCGL